MSERIVVVGAGIVGRALGKRLQRRDYELQFVERDEATAETARALDFPVVVGDGTDTAVLAEVETGEADLFVASTADDDVNLLATQLAASRFDLDRVIARVNNPANADAFEETGTEPVSESLATAVQIDNYIERPSLTNWIEELDFGGDAQEVEIENSDLDGVTLDELDERLPEQVLVVGLTREGVVEFPDPGDTVTLGDRVTVLGERAAVQQSVEHLSGELPRPDPN